MSDLGELLVEQRPDSAGWSLECTHGGGSQGAEQWRDRSGRQVVVKRHPAVAARQMDAIVARIERLRSAGVPAPVTTVALGGDHVYLVHDYVPGRSDPTLTPGLVGHLLEIVQRESGLADDSAAEWAPLIRGSLTDGLQGYCEHGSLSTYSEESRALLHRLRAAGREATRIALPALDLVHFDLHPDNIISDDGLRVSGVVDWDAVRAGDRALDLALLAFTSSWRADDNLLEVLWSAFLGASTVDARQVYMHHVALRIVDWFIRHRGPIGPERTIALATWALDLTAQGRYTSPPP